MAGLEEVIRAKLDDLMRPGMPSAAAVADAVNDVFKLVKRFDERLARLEASLKKEAN